MGTYEQIFINTTKPVREVAELLAVRFNLERIPDPEESDTDIGLRGRARTVDGYVGFRIQPNNHVEPDAELDEIQAIDAYEIEVDIWLLGKDSETQQREARVVFNRLAVEWPSAATLLCHALTFAVAAYLPGEGVHVFPPRTTMDAPDSELWRPWTIGLRPSELETYDPGSALDPATVQRACAALAAWRNERPLGPNDWSTPEDYAVWNIWAHDEWLLFTTSGGYGSGAYLVCGDTVYGFSLAWQSVEDAVRSARELRDGRLARSRRWPRLWRQRSS